MSVPAPTGVVGARLAVDRLFMAYMAATGLVALFGGPIGWMIAVAHAVIIVGLWFSAPYVPLPANGLLRFLRIAYPVLITPLLYTELGTLVQFIVQSTHDTMVMGWEEAAFGAQMSIVLSEWLPWFTLSELIHLGYATYYVIFPIAFIGVLKTRGDAALERTVFTAALGFYLCYVFFIFFPVAGPRYFFEKIGGVIAEGRINNWLHLLLEGGSSRGTAFPSSHIAATFSAVLAAGREDRRWLWALGPAAFLLAFSTVYGRFHYAVDAVAGALVAFVIVYIIAPPLFRAFSPEDVPVAAEGAGNGGAQRGAGLAKPR